MPPHDELKRRHSAFLVADIAQAIEAFAATGTRFRDVIAVPVRVESESTNADIEITFVHGLDRDIELIQAGEGPFAAEVGLGFHHLGGVGSIDLAEAIEDQRSIGVEVDYQLFWNDTLMAVFFKPTPLRPVRFELMAPHMADA